MYFPPEAIDMLCVSIRDLPPLRETFNVAKNLQSVFNSTDKIEILVERGLGS